LDENSDQINSDYIKESSTSKFTSQNYSPSTGIPGFGASNEGPSSYARSSQSYYTPNAPNKNTTFEIPKSNNIRKFEVIIIANQ
jgi:hypothetical protein